jgi:hypothetical protein
MKLRGISSSVDVYLSRKLITDSEGNDPMVCYESAAMDDGVNRSTPIHELMWLIPEAAYRKGPSTPERGFPHGVLGMRQRYNCSCFPFLNRSPK